MELTNLIYFQAVANAQSLTKAAERLFISQPSLSKSISKLERELGVELFDRTGNAITLNEYGRIFLSRVDELLCGLDDARREVGGLAGGELGNVCFGITVPEIIVDALEAYITENPEICIRQIQGSAEDMREKLLDHTIDFAISIIPIAGDNIVWTPIREDSVGVVTSAQHRLAGREVLELNELREEKFIANSNTDQQRLTVDYCLSAGFIPRIVYEGNQPELSGRLISRNFGISFVSRLRHVMLRSADEQASTENIVYHDIIPPCARVTGVAYLKNSHPLPASLRLREYLTERIKRYG